MLLNVMVFFVLGLVGVGPSVRDPDGVQTANLVSILRDVVIHTDQIPAVLKPELLSALDTLSEEAAQTLEDLQEATDDLAVAEAYEILAARSPSSLLSVGFLTDAGKLLFFSGRIDRARTAYEKAIELAQHEISERKTNEEKAYIYFLAGGARSQYCRFIEERNRNVWKETTAWFHNYLDAYPVAAAKGEINAWVWRLRQYGYKSDAKVLADKARVRWSKLIESCTDSAQLEKLKTAIARLDQPVPYVDGPGTGGGYMHKKKEER